MIKTFLSDEELPEMHKPLKVKVDVSLARRLVEQQFPQWAHLPLEPVANQGWDNRTFRLGKAMSVRMASAQYYAEQVEKEQLWLPKLAAHVPLAIPEPLAMGKPGLGYPWYWSIYRWIEGDSATAEDVPELSPLAHDLATFLVALQQVNTATETAGGLLEGPAPGAHNFYRGGPLDIYNAEIEQVVKSLRDIMDVTAVVAVWEEALSTVWHKTPVWIHGDVTLKNMLFHRGKLCAVIDFGCCAVGDPAWDLAIGWTLFHGESRQLFRSTLSCDAATWARARGWALWKTLILQTELINGFPPKVLETIKLLTQTCESP